MKSRGFTLIELLVVISIISLLSTIVITGVQELRRKARDTQRVLNLKEVQKALELYHNQYGEYPPDANPGCAPNTGITCFQCNSCNRDDTALQDKIGIYLNPRPCDPSLPGNNSNGGCANHFTAGGDGNKGFIYKVNNTKTDYKIVMSRVVENAGNTPQSMQDPGFLPGFNNDNAISLYSSEKSKDWTIGCRFDGISPVCP